jgi:7,8-dihydropterin-6-yl-methyl-4-(beta-D-ribofuranosyl)aminobenzene 5'-phosphate synthase
MLLALGAIRARNGGQEVPYYAHPGMFRSRCMMLPDGSVRLMPNFNSFGVSLAVPRSQAIGFA